MSQNDSFNKKNESVPNRIIPLHCCEASWNSITRTNAQFIHCRVLSEIKFLKSRTAVVET